MLTWKIAPTPANSSRPREEHRGQEPDLPDERRERGGHVEQRVLVDAERGDPVALHPLQVELVDEVVAERPVHAAPPVLPEAGEEVDDPDHDPDEPQRQRIRRGSRPAARSCRRRAAAPAGGEERVDATGRRRSGWPRGSRRTRSCGGSGSPARKTARCPARRAHSDGQLADTRVNSPIIARKLNVDRPVRRGMGERGVDRQDLQQRAHARRRDLQSLGSSAKNVTTRRLASSSRSKKIVPNSTTR